MSTAHDITVSSLATAVDRDAFRDIDTEWISRYFSLTDADRALLDDPDGIVAGGGDVLLARLPDSPDVVGCVALKAYPDGVFELSKMGVRPVANRPATCTSQPASRRSPATSCRCGTTTPARTS